MIWIKAHGRRGKSNTSQKRMGRAVAVWANEKIYG